MSLFEHHQITNSFARLGSAFYTRLDAQGLNEPSLLHVNLELANELGLSEADVHSHEFLQIMAGNQGLPQGQTLAAVYSGHQFGHWAGQLGDGRAHLLGAIKTTQGDIELQLKGAGLTPYSRMGDGRAVLRSSIREYLASHAMHALGVPTTQALSLVVSKDPVYRETVETAAVVCRTSPSFVRFGSFEHWVNKPQQLRHLLHYVVEHFYADHIKPQEQTDAQLVLTLLREVVKRSAHMVAHWQTVGFCHGVMNTDNMSILGLTIDYGPYAFMDSFRLDYICNTTDSGGRYAWMRQPSIVHWNLARLASCFLDICSEPDLQAVLAHYESDYLHQYQSNLRLKFGFTHWNKEDHQLANDWWKLLHDNEADFSLSFRHLAQVLEQAESWLSLFEDKDAAQSWLNRYVERSKQNTSSAEQRIELMNAHNPLFVLRNHLVQQVIEAAQAGNSTPLERLFYVLRYPFDAHTGFDDLAMPPAPGQQIPALSCSS